jgi:hypothetical protein
VPARTLASKYQRPSSPLCTPPAQVRVRTLKAPNSVRRRLAWFDRSRPVAGVCSRVAVGTLSDSLSGGALDFSPAACWNLWFPTPETNLLLLIFAAMARAQPGGLSRSGAWASADGICRASILGFVSFALRAAVRMRDHSSVLISCSLNHGRSQPKARPWSSSVRSLPWECRNESR